MNFNHIVLIFNTIVCLWMYIQGDFKEIFTTSGLQAPVLFNRSGWNFKYSYLNVCARDSENGNVVVHTVTVIVSETRKWRRQYLLFPVSKSLAHVKTLNSVGTAPICPKTDMLYTYKQFFKANEGIMHTETRHCSVMRTHIGQKKIFIDIKHFPHGCHHRQLRIACGRRWTIPLNATWHEGCF